jgi:hypothetical protein
MDQAGQVGDTGGLAGPDRVFEGVQHELGGHGCGGPPADDPAGEDAEPDRIAGQFTLEFTGDRISRSLVTFAPD